MRADLVVGFNNLRFDYEVLHGYTIVDLRQVPVRASDFLQTHDLRGRMFNHADQGGYLAYRFWPDLDPRSIGKSSSTTCRRCCGCSMSIWRMKRSSIRRAGGPSRSTR